MKRFKNILLITTQNDINSPDIKRAVSFAWSNAANLTIADVVLGMPPMHRQLTSSPGVESLLSGLAEKRLHELKSMAKELSDKMDITPLLLRLRLKLLMKMKTLTALINRFWKCPRHLPCKNQANFILFMPLKFLVKTL